MTEKAGFGLERLGHGFLDLIVGIGAIALGLTLFKKSANSAKKSKDKHADHA